MARGAPARNRGGPVIQASHIRVRTSSRVLVDDVSLELQCGTVTALIGPNGAGKSSLLKVMSGDTRPYAGTVTLDGRALHSWSPKETARRRAVLPQDSALTFPFTALDVVMMGRTPHFMRGTETIDDHAIAEYALQAVDLAGFGERLYPTLSGGERQRVQLARVLAQVWEPNVRHGRALLLDEPVAALDLAQQQRVLRLARDFAKEGVAVLVVLHDLNLAAQYADHIVLMRGGRTVAEGTPRDVLTSSIVHDVFGVSVQIVPHPCASCPLVVTMPVSS